MSHYWYSCRCSVTFGQKERPPLDFSNKRSVFLNFISSAKSTNRILSSDFFKNQTHVTVVIRLNSFFPYCLLCSGFNQCSVGKYNGVPPYAPYSISFSSSEKPVINLALQNFSNIFIHADRLSPYFFRCICFTLVQTHIKCMLKCVCHLPKRIFYNTRGIISYT